MIAIVVVAVLTEKLISSIAILRKLEVERAEAAMKARLLGQVAQPSAHRQAAVSGGGIDTQQLDSVAVRRPTLEDLFIARR